MANLAPAHSPISAPDNNVTTAKAESRDPVSYTHLILQHFKEQPLREIDQAAIDTAATTLFPDATAATRNREVYTPVSAVLKHAGLDFKIRRPKGWRGRIIRRWLWPEQAWRVVDAAYALDGELGLLCVMLLFGGLRISEQLAMTCDDIRIQEA